MTGQRQREPAALSAVTVWDLPVRLFHWILVGLLIGAWLTAELGVEAMRYHKWIGYSVLVLVSFRIVWGFVGTHHARFRHFLRPPSAVWRYARSWRTGEHAEDLGHNPLGGWMVVVLLVLVLVQPVTGLFASDGFFVEGPLASRVSPAISTLATRLHHLNFTLLLLAVATHVAAILAYWLLRGENLIGPMLHGRKQLPASQAAAAPVVRGGVVLAALLIGMLAAGLWLLIG